MKTIRGIILGLNTVVAVMVTAFIALTAFSGLGVWRVAWVTFTGVIAVYSILTAVEDAVIRKGGRNEKSGQRKNKGGSVPGVMWHQNRFRMDKQEDRHTRKDVKAVQAKPGTDYYGQAVASGKRD